MSSNREIQRVLDIVENVEAARGYLGSLELEEFVRTPLVIDACERCLQRITEAAIKLADERFASIAPSVPLALLRGMGNMLRHEYDLINPRIVYETIRHDLPVLEKECRNFLARNDEANL